MVKILLLCLAMTLGNFIAERKIKNTLWAYALGYMLGCLVMAF